MNFPKESQVCVLALCGVSLHLHADTQSQGSIAKSPAEALYVARIVSGDPSRGALSVDMEENILAGQWVQVSP